MLDGVSLQQQLAETMRDVSARIDEMGSLGRAKARAEREYRVAKRVRILYEREKGTPVSIIGDVVKGYEDIADLAFARDCAEAEYEANREALLWGKKKTDALREQIAREYGRE